MKNSNQDLERDMIYLFALCLRLHDDSLFGCSVVQWIQGGINQDNPELQSKLNREFGYLVQSTTVAFVIQLKYDSFPSHRDRCSAPERVLDSVQGNSAILNEPHGWKNRENLPKNHHRTMPDVHRS